MAKKSKQTKFQKFYVDLDVYNTDMLFLIGDADECKKFVIEQHEDSKIKDDLEIIEESFNNHEMTGVTFQTSKGVSIYIESPKDSATVSHEIFHGGLYAFEI